jgi:hypothetical protein
VIDQSQLVTPSIPNKASGARIPEFTIRKFIAFALKKISDDIDGATGKFIEELFSLHGTATVNQVKKYLRDHANVQVVHNFPRPDQHLPVVAVVNGGEKEGKDQFLGDHVGEAVYGTLGNEGVPTHTRQGFGVFLDNTTHIFVIAEDPTLVLFLSQILRYILFSASDDFNKFADMHALTIDMADLQWQQELLPEFAYMKVITMSYRTVFDVNTSLVKTICEIDLEVSVEANNPLTVTVVPFPDPE